MGKKISGIILLLAGAWWAYIWREDQHEGPPMQLTGVIVAASGFFLFLEGIKQEIIAAIKEKDSKEIQQKN